MHLYARLGSKITPSRSLYDTDNGLPGPTRTSLHSTAAHYLYATSAAMLTQHAKCALSDPEYRILPLLHGQLSCEYHYALARSSRAAL